MDVERRSVVLRGRGAPDGTWNLCPVLGSGFAAVVVSLLQGISVVDVATCWGWDGRFLRSRESKRLVGARPVKPTTRGPWASKAAGPDRHAWGQELSQLFGPS